MIAFLRNPARSLPQYGEVHDQETGQFVKYDASRLTTTMQQDILDYYSDPPRTEDGQVAFLSILTGRQMGKSLTPEYCGYVETAYRPAYDHVCIADTQERADYLHKRVHYLHQRWPDSLRSPTVPSKESRQLTFDSEFGGRMRVLSAANGAVGIGQSPDGFHASECAFWPSFSDAMFLIYPSIINRSETKAIFECTPWEAGCDWHEHCQAAKAMEGRHIYKFYPFWDGVLNRRQWKKEWNLDSEEEDLLRKYAAQGLTLEHLAFRRFILKTDAELRRNPERFKVFYPFDEISCWLVRGRGVIPTHALERHQNGLLIPSKFGYAEFLAPDPTSVYVIGVDPSGQAARDHASFQVLDLREKWRQAARFADTCDPLAFARKLFETGMRYNQAKIVVENNGVGQAVISHLIDWKYPNLYWSSKQKAGIPTTGANIDKMTSHLIDALIDDLVLYDTVTVDQLISYKGDKRIEESPGLEAVRGAPSSRRRHRHHWDAVSALIMAVQAARLENRRGKEDTRSVEVAEYEGLTANMSRQLWRERLAHDRKLRATIVRQDIAAARMAARGRR
jgi:hypothetical protein